MPATLRANASVIRARDCGCLLVESRQAVHLIIMPIATIPNFKWPPFARLSARCERLPRMHHKRVGFRHDLLTLLGLLKERKIKPLIAQRLPLEEARHAHEMLGAGGVLGKIVLLPNG